MADNGRPDKKVLITGGAGFIGTHLARYLIAHNNTCQVDLVDNFARGVNDDAIQRMAQKPNVHLHTLNILEPEALTDLDTDYDYVYHLAAIIGVANVLERPYEVLRNNVVMLLNMLDWASRQTDLQRLVFASTSEVYAGTLRHFALPLPTPEVTPLALTDLGHPRTSYMLSKIYGEALCHQSGLPFTIFRPHNIYGPRMGLAHVIPELLQKAHRASDGDEFEVFSVDHRRAFCFIGDAVEMIVRASEAPDGAGQTLNLGNQDAEVSIGELVQVILDTVGKRLRMSPQPATPGSPARRCPDMTQTQALTGVRAQVSLHEGVKQTYQWYRDNVFDQHNISAR